MNQNTGKRARVAGIAVIILLILAIIGVVAYYFISNNKKTIKTTTSAVVVTNNEPQNEPQQTATTKPDTTRIASADLATVDFLQFAQTELTDKCTSMTIKGQLGDNVVVSFAFGEEVNGVCEPSGGALKFYHKTNNTWALAFGTQAEVPCSKFVEFNIPRELPNADTCLDLATNKTITNPITSQ